MDKGFNDIKNAIDEFFASDIFIQEAIELMDPVNRKQKRNRKDPEAEFVKNIVSKAKTTSEEVKAGNEELPIMLSESEPDNLTGEIPNKPAEIKHSELSINEIKVIEGDDLLKSDLTQGKSLLSGEFYSDDLLFASVLQPHKEEIPLSPEELKDKKFNELFCEVTYRKRIVKKIFKKDENFFKETVMKLFDCVSWQEASEVIEKHFENNHVDFCSEEAVRFVDIIESYFDEDKFNSNQQSIKL
jgi:hypothetical protein